MAKKLINKVLIVDDSEENRMILEEICKNLGYESELAENGKQALEYLRIKPFVYSLGYKNAYNEWN